MIIRTYGCPACNHLLEVQLTAEQVDDPPPACPMCAQRTAQEFKAPAIIGSDYSKARKHAETIAEQDYGVADMNVEGYQGVRNKVRYKDQTSTVPSSFSAQAQQALHTAIAAGRENRMRYGGDGLDALQRNLRSGDQPDLIELSKRRSARIW